MPRRRVVTNREILPDPIYNSKVVSKFISAIMKDGEEIYGGKNMLWSI